MEQFFLIAMANITNGLKRAPKDFPSVLLISFFYWFLRRNKGQDMFCKFPLLYSCAATVIQDSIIPHLNISTVFYKIFFTINFYLEYNWPLSAIKFLKLNVIMLFYFENLYWNLQD